MDTDSRFGIKPLDSEFYDFVSQFDISYIPFTSTVERKQSNPIANFKELASPYWRIESGIVALSVTDDKAALSLLEETVDLYRGTMLKVATTCLQNPDGHHACRDVWFQRNLYLDDIFAFSLMLHKHKHRMKQGWFYVGPGFDYDYLHTEKGMTPYTSKFDLFKYIVHSIGAGAYSVTFRKKLNPDIDVELLFLERQKFADLVEFRFPGSNPETHKDLYWFGSLVRKGAAVFPPARIAPA